MGWIFLYSGFAEVILTLENIQIKFGILLAYSYLCSGKLGKVYKTYTKTNFLVQL